MNKWIKRVVAYSIVVAQFLVIPAVSASSLEDIQNQKRTVETEVQQVQTEINDKLSEASKISIALDELEREIEEHKTEIVKTEKAIEEQAVLVERRYEHTAEQLKAMQKSEINQNIIIGLFQAESLTDFFNRLYTASVLTSANEEHIVEAQTEHEKLNNLKADLVTHQEELDKKQVAIVKQKEELDAKLADLKQTLAANQHKLSKLNSEEAAIRAAEARKREEAARAAAAKKAAAEKAQAPAQQAPAKTATAKATQKAASSSSNASASKPAQTSSQSSSSQAGSWMSFQATGYSTQQPGLSTHTATGINLLVNPRVIAVDPSQIPLDSLVEVQGLGIYVAGDTGGAIKGRIIDIHFPTVRQALNWGRRSVNIRIIN